MNSRQSGLTNKGTFKTLSPAKQAARTKGSIMLHYNSAIVQLERVAYQMRELTEIPESGIHINDVEYIIDYINNVRAQSLQTMEYIIRSQCGICTKEEGLLNQYNRSASKTSKAIKKDKRNVQG